MTMYEKSKSGLSDWEKIGVVSNILQWVVVISAAYLWQVAAGQSSENLTNAIRGGLESAMATSPIPETATLQAIALAALLLVVLSAGAFPAYYYTTVEDKSALGWFLAVASFQYPFLGASMLSKDLVDDSKIVSPLALVFYVGIWSPTLFSQLQSPVQSLVDIGPVVLVGLSVYVLFKSGLISRGI